MVSTSPAPLSWPFWERDIMSILITSDLHFDEKIVNDGYHEKLSGFLREQQTAHRANMLFILGDFFSEHLDPHRRIAFKVLDAIADFFHSLDFEKIVILKGNHDESFIGHHNLKILSLDFRVQIIDTPTIVKINNIKFLFIPFCKDKDLFYSIIDQAEGGENVIALIHQPIVGFRVSAKHACTNGIDSNKLHKFALVVAGDFHDYQSQGNVVFIGSPYQVRRDEDLKKFMMSISDDRVSLIELPVALSQRFIFVENATQIDQLGDLRGKIVVVSEDVDIDKINQLRDKGVKIVSSKALMKESAPVVEVDLSSFSVNLLKSAVERMTDPYMKAVGQDLLERIGYGSS